MTEVIQVLTTTSSREEAHSIAQALVERRLAGCVQMLGPITSTYRWQDKVESRQEWLLLIKTRREEFDTLEQAIRELHSYEVPEILAVPVVAGSQGYLDWLTKALRPD